MKKYFFKPVLDNPSQGARIEYLRKLRGYSIENIAEYFGWGGEDPNETYRKWRTNNRSPQNDNLKQLAELFGVNINAIKNYKFIDPIEQVFYHMWEEEQFPYSKLSIDIDSYKKTTNNQKVVKGLNEWEKMREKRMNGEITDEEYIEWKLNLVI